jgi:hypothetical protein
VKIIRDNRHLSCEGPRILGSMPQIILTGKHEPDPTRPTRIPTFFWAHSLRRGAVKRLDRVGRKAGRVSGWRR